MKTFIIIVLALLTVNFLLIIFSCNTDTKDTEGDSNYLKENNVNFFYIMLLLLITTNVLLHVFL
jgi:hypothetical protein